MLSHSLAASCRLQTSLRRTGLLRRAQLIHARVPIIKAELNVNGELPARSRGYYPCAPDER